MALRATKYEPLQHRIIFKSPVTRAQLGTLVTEVIKHVLYDRERLPMPFDQFKKFLRDTWSSDSLNMHETVMQQLSRNQERKAVESFNALDHALSTISDMVQQNQVHEIRFMIGSTYVTPSEQYLIRVPHEPTCEECGNSRGLRQCLLDMMSTLMNCSAGQPPLPSSEKVMTFLRTKRRHVPRDIMELHQDFHVPWLGKIWEFDFVLKTCPHAAESADGKVSADSGSECSGGEVPSQGGNQLEHGHDKVSSDVEDTVVWARIKNVFPKIEMQTFSRRDGAF